MGWFGSFPTLADGENRATSLGIIIQLPAMLSDLHHHRIDALTPRTPLRRESKPDRNDPCPCGSGKKYKKCCGA